MRESGWWLVEEMENGIQVRSVAYVDDKGRCRHIQFALDYSIEEMEQNYGFKFICLVELWPDLK